MPDFNFDFNINVNFTDEEPPFSRNTVIKSLLLLFVHTIPTGLNLVIIYRIISSISHFCGLPPNFLVTVPFKLFFLCVFLDVFSSPMWSELTHLQDPSLRKKEEKKNGQR